MGRIIQRQAARRAPNGQLLDSLLEAKVLTEDWRIDYNTNRIHSGLGRNTPAQFAADWLTRNQQLLA